jgi:enoyl-[acyl-carrier protein] reductase III
LAAPAHDLDYTGRRVLVTGGSGDIGRALCVAFAARGAQVAFTWFSSHEGCAATEAAMRAVAPAGAPEPVAIRANLRGKDGPDEVVAGLDAAGFDTLHIFASNAASGVLRPALELTGKHWDWTLTVNAKSFLELTTRLAPRMGPGGRILALTSAGATRAIENYAAVGASKAALESLVRHFAQALGPKGITVNALCPGVVDTQALKHFPNREQLLEVAAYRTPNGRIATPEDVARVALLVASPLAEMIQGQTLNIDGGYSILA